jgi:hypothetical protein
VVSSSPFCREQTDSDTDSLEEFGLDEYGDIVEETQVPLTDSQLSTVTAACCCARESELWDIDLAIWQYTGTSTCFSCAAATMHDTAQLYLADYLMAAYVCTTIASWLFYGDVRMHNYS